MTQQEPGVLDTAAYAKALAFARSLEAPGNPLNFPSYSDYVRLVAERVVIDLDSYDPDMADFQELPEPFELAYLTARLERLRKRIADERGVDGSEL